MGFNRSFTKYDAINLAASARLAPRRPKVAPASTAEVLFCAQMEDGNCLDDLTATVDLEYGEIVSVQIGEFAASPVQIEQMMGHANFAAEYLRIKALIPDLVRQAEIDAFDAEGDIDDD